MSVQFLVCSTRDWALVFVMIQFCEELPCQPESRDKAVNGSVCDDVVFGVNDPENQPTLRFLQRFDERLVAFFHLLALS